MSTRTSKKRRSVRDGFLAGPCGSTVQVLSSRFARLPVTVSFKTCAVIKFNRLWAECTSTSFPYASVCLRVCVLFFFPTVVAVTHDDDGIHSHSGREEKGKEKRSKPAIDILPQRPNDSPTASRKFLSSILFLLATFIRSFTCVACQWKEIHHSLLPPPLPALPL